MIETAFCKSDNASNTPITGETVKGLMTSHFSDFIFLVWAPYKV